MMLMQMHIFFQLFMIFTSLKKVGMLFNKVFDIFGVSARNRKELSFLLLGGPRRLPSQVDSGSEYQGRRGIAMRVLYVF